MFLPERPDMEDMECFQEDTECFQVTGVQRGGGGHLSRREANWERRVSSVSDSVALDTVSTVPRSQTPSPLLRRRQGAQGTQTPVVGQPCPARTRSAVVPASSMIDRR